MKWVKFTLGCSFIVAVGVLTAVKFGSFEVRALEQKVRALEAERQQLVDYASRLSASRRVAQVEVLDQHPDERGRTVNVLRWQEIGPDGILGQPLTVQATGRLVYFEALVIKFAFQHVQEADPARGVSLALFRRIFGDAEAAESVPELDRSARPPRRHATEEPNGPEELWGRFWEMVDHPEVAQRYGVRVVQCEAPAVPVRTGQVWEVAVDAAGGVNLRKLSDAPPRSAADDAGADGP